MFFMDTTTTAQRTAGSARGSVVSVPALILGLFLLIL